LRDEPAGCKFQSSDAGGRKCHAATREAFREALPGCREAREDRSAWAAEFARRVFGGVAAQITERHRPAEPFRQPRDFRVEQFSEFLTFNRRNGQLDRCFDDGMHNRSVAKRSPRNSARDFEEPTGDISALDRAGFACKHEEHRLERVFGKLLVADRAVTHAEHHSTVPPDEQFKRGFVRVLSESTKQLRIRDAITDGGSPASFEQSRQQPAETPRHVRALRSEEKWLRAAARFKLFSIFRR